MISVCCLASGLLHFTFGPCHIILALQSEGIYQMKSAQHIPADFYIKECGQAAIEYFQTHYKGGQGRQT